MGAEKGTLQLLEGDSLRIVAHHGHQQPFLDFFASAETKASVCGEATQRGERVAVPDVEESALFAGTPSLAVLREAGVRAVQSTPLTSRSGALLGILTTHWAMPYSPDEHDLWRIDLLVRQAADLIEQVKAEEALRGAHDELEQRVRERTTELGKANRELALKNEENVRALESLRTSRQHLAEAQRIARLGNWEWDFATDELTWSDEMFRILGLVPQSLAVNFEGFMERVHPDDRALLQERLDRALSGGEEFKLQYRIVLPDGDVRFIRAQGEITRDAAGKPARMFGMGMDVTEQVRAEEEARIRQQQLVQADKMVSLGILTSGVAHEINNPNHSILSNVTVLRDVWDGARPIMDRFYEDFGDFVLAGYDYSECRDKLPDMFANALASSKRIEVIVTELRDYARGNSTERMAPVDVNAVVNSSVILLSSLIKKHTDCFSVELAQDPPTVMGNFQRLEQVLVNLIQNACQALPDRDRAVTVFTRHDRPSGRVIIEVVDQGVGVTKEDIKQMGTPFYTTKIETRGTGLGLWISTNIAHEHGGTLTFSSREGEGTRAVFSLPAEA